MCVDVCARSVGTISSVCGCAWRMVAPVQGTLLATCHLHSPSPKEPLIPPVCALSSCALSSCTAAVRP
eukprot:366048-Chlamydomonas_euryale.AAC.6